MTIYHVTVRYAGRTFTRAFESMIARELFKVDAKKIGARVEQEWAEAAPAITSTNERIVTEATRKWLGA